MSDVRTMVIYNDSLDGNLAAAYYKKLWVDKQSILPGEEKKAFLENGDKLASYDGSLTFHLYKKDAKLPELDYTDRLVLLDVELTEDQLKFLYKKFGKSLLWFGFRTDAVDKLSRTHIDKDTYEFLVAGLRGNVHCTAALMWIYFNGRSADHMPKTFKMISNYVTGSKDYSIYDKDTINNFYRHCKKVMKSYNHWYDYLKDFNEKKEDELIKKANTKVL